MRTLGAVLFALVLGSAFGQDPFADHERAVSTALLVIPRSQADFRGNDRDGNHVNDFWVADVSGLYRIDTGTPLKLIEESVAQADAKPCVPLDQAGWLPGASKEHAVKLAALGKPTPRAGYWFAVVEKYQNDQGAEVKYGNGNGRNESAFAVCAYPSEYGKTGRFTYILNEAEILWKKDAGGKPPEVFPSAPAKAGWTLVSKPGAFPGQREGSDR